MQFTPARGHPAPAMVRLLRNLNTGGEVRGCWRALRKTLHVARFFVKWWILIVSCLLTFAVGLPYCILHMMFFGCCLLCASKERHCPCCCIGRAAGSCCRFRCRVRWLRCYCPRSEKISDKVGFAVFVVMFAGGLLGAFLLLTPLMLIWVLFSLLFWLLLRCPHGMLFFMATFPAHGMMDAMDFFSDD